MIAVVVLTFDAPEGMLAACVRALRRDGPADLPVIVVDNGGRARELPFELRRRVDLVETGANLGFAGGMNVGLRRALAAGATGVMIINDDVEVHEGWLAPLVDELERDPTVGAVQPKLVYPGEPRRVNSMGVRLGADGAGTDVAMGRNDDDVPASAHEIELFTGGAVLLRAEFLRAVGMFDDRYFMYYEDVDLGLRGRRQGWRYVCAPASCVVHHGGATVAQVGDRAVYWRERNRLWILFRHRPARHVACGVWLSTRRLRWAPRMVHLRAFAAGVAAAPRLLWARWRAATAVPPASKRRRSSRFRLSGSDP